MQEPEDQGIHYKILPALYGRGAAPKIAQQYGHLNKTRTMTNQLTCQQRERDSCGAQPLNEGLWQVISAERGKFSLPQG